MANHETIHDLADRAVSTPETLSHPDIVRLGAWVVDRQEHIAAHKQAMADASGQPADAPSELLKRMPPPVKTLPSTGTGETKPVADEWKDDTHAVS